MPGIDAKRLDQDLPEGEKVLIQGIIDVFFIENGEIVLLDYKTDVIDSLQALWNRYSVQIQYYEGGTDEADAAAREGEDPVFLLSGKIRVKSRVNGGFI